MTNKWIRFALFPLLIAVGWYWAASYTFNEKPDLNGDNINYYIYASSLASGQGYSDLSKLGSPATATFPPGYPLLMTPLRMMTDSIVAQKWMNELFVLFSLLLLYFILLRLQLPVLLSFVAAFSGAFVPRLLHFSTMMMSEASFCMTSVIALYFLLRMSDDESSWWSELRHPWVYLMVLALVTNYHIRTQGLALLAGIGFGLLVRRRWAALGTTAVGFVLGYLPWFLRNKALGMGGNRYLATVMVANPWRPEEGALTIAEFVERFFETLRMLVFAAIPNTIPPFSSINPDAPEFGFGAYLLGAVLVALMLYGCWQLGKLRWTMFGYIAATLCLISVFSTPSGSRYITTILPLLVVLEVVGLWAMVNAIVERIGKKQGKQTGNMQHFCREYSALLFLPILLMAKPGMELEHKLSNQRTPIQYQQFFNIGKELQKHTPENTVVCSRKPQMLWMYAHRPGCTYLFTQDDKELIRDLIEKEVDYVILDALGYSSTALYLFPAVQKNAQYFSIVQQYDNTHTYLLKFHRSRAADEF